MKTKQCEPTPPPRDYQTLAAPMEFTREEKRSRFCAFIYPITDKSEGFAHLERLKSTYADARHHCWAYVIGDPEQALSAGFNDDGEPGGTAGKPMLNVLMQRKVGDVFAVVVRYFGGIKLGAGGLTRAYGAAVSGALDAAQWRAVVAQQAIQIDVDFALEERVRNLLAKAGIEEIRSEYGEQVTLFLQCPAAELTALQKAVSEQTAGAASIRLVE